MRFWHLFDITVCYYSSAKRLIDKEIALENLLFFDNSVTFFRSVLKIIISFIEEEFDEDDGDGWIKL